MRLITNNAEVQLALDIGGAQLYRLLEVGACTRDIVAFVGDDSKSVVGWRVGLNRQHPMKHTLRVRQLTALQIRGRQIILTFHVEGILLLRLLVVRDSLFQIAGSQIQISESRKDHAVQRSVMQRLLADLHGLRVFTGCLVFIGQALIERGVRRILFQHILQQLNVALGSR